MEATEYSSEMLTDEELVLRSQAGDTEALEAIIERYRGLAKLRTRSYFLAGAESDDLVQEAMIGLFKAARDYDPKYGASFKTFANICITRQMLTAIKGATRYKHQPLNSYISLNRSVFEEDDGGRPLLEMLATDNDSDPESIYLRNEWMVSLSQAVPRVLSKLELRVLLYYLRGLSYETIAQRIGRPVKTVDNAIQRMKRKMELYFRNH
ncbi:MAG: RNA polymerase sporulation sigma factor SigH [Negativicoccus succinicivorans]|uniref:RNA polymerase sporulation sigma factor SigH n=1 Tax=Negativicoccus succinicivorans TaxID=620903 RepID=UPI0007643CE4|nr:RNA polymerase sporulation sigma factor SigH [Negativicoccus succinicivorans]KWZ77900.1 RNA polymerase factor sigma-70 [Anaerococcus hydrogenalis]MDU5914595.1 RNA polymerase sporulation sigma factor SigH [Negativicoccus succinicivorans]